MGKNCSATRIATFGDGAVIIGERPQAGVAAPVVRDAKRSRHDGALDETAQGVGAAAGGDGEANTTGVAAILPFVLGGAGLPTANFDSGDDKCLMMVPTVNPVFSRHFRQRRTPARVSRRNGSRCACGRARNGAFTRSIVAVWRVL